MVVYDLTCSKGHVFEAWFRSSEAFDEEKRKRRLVCGVCGDKKVKKGLQAPNIAPAREASPTEQKKAAAAMYQMLVKMRDHVEKNAEHVGEKFAEEARKIHYGEKEARNIYGEATDEQAEELQEEGIEFGRLPWVPRPDA